MKNRLFGQGFAATGHNLASRPSRQWQLQSFALMFVVTVLALSSVSLEAQRAKRAAIATRWAKDVDVTNPLPEYPRPQMVRKGLAKPERHLAVPEWPRQRTGSRESDEKQDRGAVPAGVCPFRSHDAL